MSVRRVLIQFCCVFVYLSLLLIGGVALAQGETTPIAIGENAFGELTAEVSIVQYSVTATGGETANIQVLALSDGFVPRFRLVNPAGIEVLTVPNPDGLNMLTASASFADVGDYLIEIQGENNTVGQFALSLQPGAALPEAVELVIDQPIAEVVGSQNPVRVYHFNTTTEPLVLTILSDEPDSGVLISLYNEDAGKTIATSDASVSGVAYRLPPEERSYRVEVRAGGEAADTAYSICLGNCGGGLLSAEATVEPETVTATCTVISAAGTAVNVRSGPGTQYAVIGNLAAGQSYPALGQLSGGEWYQVSVNGQSGWVAASVTQLDGDCANLAQVAAPANAQLAATQPPPPAQPSPTQPSSGSTPTLTPTSQPTLTLTPSQTPLSLADLTVTINEAYPNPDGTLHVSWTVNNIGTRNAVDFWVEACFDSSCSPTYVSTAVPPGGNFSLSQNTSIGTPPAGLFYLVTVNADVDDNVPESNEGNNSASTYLQ